MKNFMLLLLIFCAAQVQAGPTQIALTFDDFPYVSKTPPAGYSNQKLIQNIVDILAKYKIQGVVAFVNAGKIVTPEDKEILDLWVRQGHVLGNHVWSHPDLNKVSSAQYISEIDKNHQVLLSYSEQFVPYFRYPFLHEGNTQEKRTSVRNHLFQSGYRIAQVTVHHDDWEWAAPYTRCLKQQNEAGISWLRKTYNEEASENLRAATLMSDFLFQRSIQHVALFHPNAMTVEQLDQVLENWKLAGVEFSSLQEATSDPVYKIDPNVVRDSPHLFTNQIRLMRHLQNPAEVTEIFKKTNEIELQLEKVCL